VVWGSVSLWQSLMRLDLIDEFRLDLYPYVAGQGTRLFNDDVPKSYRLDLVSSTAFSNGIVGLQYRAPLTQWPASPHGGCDGSARGCVITGMA
jgi:dihydrofolate reductase